MRNLMIVITTCFAVGLFASAADGASVSIKVKVSRAQLLSACDKAGGTFHSSSSGYGCEKRNCDGKGGSCQVTCTKNGKCGGYTPGIVGGKGKLSGNVAGVLTGAGSKATGVKVRPAPTAGSGSPKVARNPVLREKLRDQRTEPKIRTNLGRATTQPQTASQPRQQRHR